MAPQCTAQTEIATESKLVFSSNGLFSLGAFVGKAAELSPRILPQPGRVFSLLPQKAFLPSTARVHQKSKRTLSPFDTFIFPFSFLPHLRFFPPFFRLLFSVFFLFVSLLPLSVWGSMVISWLPLERLLCNGHTSRDP